jgi:hypothetical protein
MMLLDEPLILSAITIKNNTLRQKSTGRKLPRVRPGFVKIGDRVFSTRDIWHVLLSHKKQQGDGRMSDGMKMIYAQPDAVIERDVALTVGLSHYRTGKPCRRGHTSWRYTKSGACIACKGYGPDKPKPILGY